MKHNLILLVPEEQWDVLHQSLILDSESAHIARPLRQQIKKALDSITPVTGPVAELLDEAEMVSRAGWTTTSTGLRAFFIGERMETLIKALKFFRSPFTMLGGKRIYKKKIA